MRFSAQRPGRSRRGLTLLEMLVTVALLLLIMTIIVQIFQSATGAITASRAYQELDQGLRRLDSTIRQDLKGVTARLTPPLDPKDNLGYFEYGENAFADAQGEDTDDYVRFTTKAPEGQPFTGRAWLRPPANQLIQPTLVTSQYAEVIYFLRNGNLYRRVLLVAPERQSSISSSATFSPTSGPFSGLTVSWQGMNDLSAHPSPTFKGTTAAPILNTLGDLTNREYRAFHPRFINDTYARGRPDEENGDGVPDFYPTLYREVFSTNLMNEAVVPARSISGNLQPFPYLYPWAYSRPDLSAGPGWIHSLDPSGTTFNQAPLEIGDSLPVPTGTAGRQTWFGFPTWRETMSAAWTDPTFRTPGSQPLGLQYRDPATPPAGDVNNNNFLPPVTGQPFNDGAGSASFQTANVLWEDDLIMTGVRSFDIKAYDNVFAGYVDLGWGDDLRLYQPFYPPGTPPATAPYLNGTQNLDAAGAPVVTGGSPVIVWPPNQSASVLPPVAQRTYDMFSRSCAHEGRIPPLGNNTSAPLVNDNRFDPQAPAFNVGDNQAGVVRLRRVWDSWSTDYTRAPGSSINSRPGQGGPWGLPFSRPVYPSYPPPYPMPLRGIQIQIRVVDPRNERIKTLTIRQDFSDKL